MKLSDYIASREVSLSTIARRAGIAHSTLIRALRGTHLPTRRVRQMVALATSGAVSEAEFLAEAHEASLTPAESPRSDERHRKAA